MWLPDNRGTDSLSIRDGSATPAVTTPIQVVSVPMKWAWWYDADLLSVSSPITTPVSSLPPSTSASRPAPLPIPPQRPFDAATPNSSPDNNIFGAQSITDSASATDSLATPISPPDSTSSRQLLEEI